jgi:hypothetical protein
MNLVPKVRGVLVGVGLVGAGLWAAPVAAKCMLPMPTMAPADGAVPAQPVLRLILPVHDPKAPPPRLVARIAGAEVPVTVTLDTAIADLRSYRVAIAAPAAGVLEVELRDAADAVLRDWRFTIDPTWRAPATARSTVSVTRDAYQWTCSHQQTRDLRFTGAAAAYRVVLTDVVDGTVTTVVLPATAGEFFGYRVRGGQVRTPDDEAVVLALGHVSCLGSTLEWTADKLARVYALWPDGSELPVTREPVPLSPP